MYVLCMLMFSFINIVTDSPNAVIQAICNSDIWWQSSIRSHWVKLLYTRFAGQGPG